MPPASDPANAFTSWALPGGDDLFAELSASVTWEELGKGRRGAVLTKVDEAGGVPLVRTTSRYRNPAQRFLPLHARLAQRIQEQAALPVAFNNALAEHYTDAYRTMGSHSDQALDLADDSFIAVYSCYQYPASGSSRKLVVESKESAGATADLPLTHHGFVLFSVASNRRHRHRIVLDTSAAAPENPWLGLTFRTSKTLLRHRDGQAHLPCGTRLSAADDEQRREFYRLRRRENTETDFDYPTLTCTISESDLVPPTGSG
ncbi:hypothetical protein [Streptomyces cremeus]|uniref:Alpha-ketoglutarate-dependent dioxygenase AlkB n=1 Tax=Streptomyces cremeus TaxID=66881 RepID=A0ABV5PNL9_STRCM